MRPTRFDLSLQHAREFVAEWFDQNPLGQIGLIGLRAGVGERIGEISGIQKHRMAKSIANLILRLVDATGYRESTRGAELPEGAA